MILGISLLIFATFFLIAAGVYRWLSTDDEIQRRVDGMTSAQDLSAENEIDRQLLARKVSQQLSRFSMMARLEQQLTAADSNLTVAEFMLMRIGAVLGCLIVGWVLSGSILGGLGLSVLGWIAPAIMLGRQQERRIRLFNEQLPDMLSLVVGALRAGYGLMHACRVVNQEMPDPIAKEFSRVIREIALGYSVNRAFENMTQRVTSDDLELITTAIAIQNETGGSLADMLDKISQTVRERVKLHGEIQVLTSQQRYTGYVLTGLPFVTFVLIMLINPDYVMPIFDYPWVFIPVTALIMIAIGNFFMRQITKIEV